MDTRVPSRTTCDIAHQTNRLIYEIIAHFLCFLFLWFRGYSRRKFHLSLYFLFLNFLSIFEYFFLNFFSIITFNIISLKRNALSTISCGETGLSLITISYFLGVYINGWGRGGLSQEFLFETKNEHFILRSYRPARGSRTHFTAMLWNYTANKRMSELPP